MNEKASEALKKACKLLDHGKSEMARRISALSGVDVSHQRLHYWIRTGHVPPEMAIHISRAVDGKVRKEDLCPKFPWKRQ